MLTVVLPRIVLGVLFLRVKLPFFEEFCLSAMLNLLYCPTADPIVVWVAVLLTKLTLLASCIAIVYSLILYIKLLVLFIKRGDLSEMLLL